MEQPTTAAGIQTTPAPLAWRRSICPRCGSAETLQLLTDGPGVGSVETLPHWVIVEESSELILDRSCEACGFGWCVDTCPEDEDYTALLTEDDPPLLTRVVCAVIVENGAVLAARRLPEHAAGGLWEFPGGKVELGESESGALRREIAEELGTKIRVASLIGRSRTPSAGSIIELACYQAHLDGPAPTSSSDHDRLVWMEPAELRGLDWSPADRPLLDIVIERLTH